MSPKKKSSSKAKTKKNPSRPLRTPPAAAGGADDELPPEDPPAAATSGDDDELPPEDPPAAAGGADDELPERFTLSKKTMLALMLLEGSLHPSHVKVVNDAMENWLITGKIAEKTKEVVLKMASVTKHGADVGQRLRDIVNFLEEVGV